MAKKGPKTKEVDKGFKSLLKEFKKLEKRPYVKVGFPANSKKANNGKEFNVPGEEDLTLINDFITVLEVAIHLEFGTKFMAERPFIRGSFDLNKNKYIKLNKKLMRKILDSELTVEKALDILGMTLENDIKAFIQQKKVKPESLRAINENGTTLYDTGQLINSITYVKVMSGKR